ncbi:hypothetical protein BDM02DRAFT_1761164 [Thelephora ganbajun]|uniref:Uncharacterized protein n=1 Tax=Thelephora ganbajun TaxID=370292 RepID=A0ACB6Z1L4_THEGA|nr:hypothetical protein BDM02DRAFT_1761164 [Thelephora ganbajun]
MLLLSWIGPGSGRGIMTPDLLNCTGVCSVPSPTHPSAKNDICTIASQAQASDRDDPDLGQLGDMNLVEVLCLFQLLYSDGIKRPGAESARERVRWASAIRLVTQSHHPFASKNAHDVPGRYWIIPRRSLTGPHLDLQQVP